MADQLSSKDPEEIIVMTFDFTRALIPTEAIASVVYVSNEANGDPLASAMLIGIPQISGSQVLQEVAGGINRITYHLRVSVSTSLGRRLINAAYLPVRKV